ncbi:MAG TPA: alpha/beta hydrolase [Gaiellaceae bacterium]
MPIGYLITTGLVAGVALAAVKRHRPGRSSPFRLSGGVGVLLNWPLAVFVALVGSTALAIDQNGVGSPVFWIGLGFTLIASGGLVVLRGRAQGTGPALERALDEGLGADWRADVDAGLAARLGRRPSLARVLLAPVSARRRRVERVANIRYGPARRANLLDLYRDRSDRSGRPVLVHFHPLFGSKRLGTRYLIHRLAAAGWICVSANYSRASDDAFLDPVIDVKKVVAWVREHASEYGADPSAIFMAGSSLGGHLASLAAFAAEEPVAGIICLYGYYGDVARDGSATARLRYATSAAPPCFVAHGDQDLFVIVDDARGFVEQLRATSSNPVVYAELPGAQHGFDLFRSRRFDTVIDAIEAFAAHIRSRAREAELVVEAPAAP